MKLSSVIKECIICLLLSFCIHNLSAQHINASVKIHASGSINDFYIDGNEVIIVTGAGTIETYNLQTGKQTGIIKMPEIHDFMGDAVASKVYSIDKTSGMLLYVIQGHHGFRNVYLKQGENTIKLIDADINKMLVKKARFISDNQILLALMSNDLILYEIDKRNVSTRLSISPYTFSDFDLDASKKFAYTTDESGVVHKVNLMEGKIVSEYSGNNVDNVFKLAYKNGTLITAGQDRRVGIYSTQLDSRYYLQKDFLVYCVGLNSSGMIGAYTADETNTIYLFDVLTRSHFSSLKGHKGIVSRIEFVDEHTIVSGSEDGYLMIWEIE